MSRVKLFSHAQRRPEALDLPIRERKPAMSLKLDVISPEVSINEIDAYRAPLPQVNEIRERPNPILLREKEEQDIEVGAQMFPPVINAQLITQMTIRGICAGLITILSAAAILYFVATQRPIYVIPSFVILLSSFLAVYLELSKWLEIRRLIGSKKFLHSSGS